MRIGDLAPIAIVFVVAGIVMSIGTEVMSNMKTSLAAQDADAAADNTTEGIGKLADWLPTIGLVVAAAIVIGVVFSSFIGGKAS